MILDKIAEEQGITYTDEEYNEVIQRYMENEGFTGTMEDFIAGADDIALYMIKETEVLKPKVMEYLKGNVVIVESPEEETEAAEESASEEASDAEEASEAEESSEAEETSEAEESSETEAETEAEAETK